MTDAQKSVPIRVIRAIRGYLLDSREIPVADKDLAE